MNTVLKKRGKYCFEKYFFRLINNAFFGKTMENLRKNRDIKLLKTKRRTKIFPEHLLAMVMKQKQIVMNKPVYLGLSILELSKMLMYEFWYDYIKPEYGKKNKTVLYGYR